MKNHRHLDLRTRVVLMVAAVVLAACGALGVPTPQTFNQNLAVAVSVNTEVRNTATALLQARKIDASDAEWVQKQADLARQGLDAARAVHATNPEAAGDKLDLASGILKQIQAFLTKRQAALPTKP